MRVMSHEITRSFDATSLDLIRRAFQLGSPDPEMLANPGFPFGTVTHAAAVARLAATRPGEVMKWPAFEWDYFVAVCSMGADADYDLLVGLIAAAPDLFGAEPPPAPSCGAPRLPPGDAHPAADAFLDSRRLLRVSGVPRSSRHLFKL